MEYYINASNWPTSLDDAKAFAREAVDNFKYKSKQEQFYRDIDSAVSVKKLQFMIVNAMLSGEGLSVAF